MKSVPKKSIFNNKVAIVTGGANGIGHELCKQLSENGAKVVIADIDIDKTEKIADQINNLGGQTLVFSVDVTKAELMQNLIAYTLENYGTLDYIFNNAGIAVAGEFQDIPIIDYKSVIDTNLLGTLYGSYYAYQFFLKKGQGHIVNIASAAGLFPSALLSNYSISKTSIIRLSEQLQMETLNSKISITLICPGFIDTNLTNSQIAGTTLPFDYLLEKIYPKPLSKKITVEECVNQILSAVSKKEFLVVFPIEYKIAYYIYKFFPNFALRQSLGTLNKFRKNKN